VDSSTKTLWEVGCTKVLFVLSRLYNKERGGENRLILINKYMKFDKDSKLLFEAYQKVEEMAIGSVQRTSSLLGKPPNKYVYTKDDLGKEEDPLSRGEKEMFTTKFDKYADYLKKNIFTKIPFEFNIFLQDYEITNKDRDEVQRLVDKDKNSITVFMSNEGRKAQHILTPWILAHRIAHCFSSSLYPFRNKITGESKYTICDKLMTNINNIIKNYLSSVDKNWDTFEGVDIIKLTHREFTKLNRAPIYQKVGTFKSARDLTVNGFEEFVHEIIAQYMMSGKITFNPLPTKEEASKVELQLKQATEKLFTAVKGCYCIYYNE
jgi:hypothetical protein